VSTEVDISSRRIPPNSFDAERAVIGALMLDNNAVGEVLPILAADGGDFYHTSNRLLFRAEMELVSKGTVADTITITDALRNRGELDKIGGLVFIAETFDAAISPANIKYYAEIVKNKAIERTILSAASRLVDAVYSPTGDTTEILTEAQRTILGLTVTQEQNTTRMACDIAKRTFGAIEKRSEQGSSITGLSTGLRGYDDLTLGLHAGELTIIAARPGMGKTALALSIARRVSLANVPVLFFSLEMPAETLMLRLFSGLSGIDSRQLRRGFVQNSQWKQLADAANKVGHAPLFIDDKPDITVAEVRAKARRLKAEHGLGLLIVDYLQLMRSSGKHDSREQAVADISRTLKAIARELEIPVIGLSQLNRQVDSRPDKRPMLSDLRESGAIEQDADVIAFIIRDEAQGTAEINIAKHRNGPTGSVSVQFEAKTQTFRDLDVGGCTPH
jgi:replicative DNA helicase